MAIIFSLTRDYSLKIENKEVQNLEGYIVSEVSKSEKTQSFTLKTLEKNILVRTDKYFKYNYGDKLSISGNLEIPESFENENGKVFDYRNFLLKNDIYYTSFYPSIRILEKESKKDFKFYIFSFKEKLTSQSKRIFSRETSSLVLGVLLGVVDSIDPDLEENFRKTGLIHILVLSGFNLTIIAYFVFKVLGSFHRNIRYVLSLFFIVIFSIMVGAGATIVRAAVMIFIFILSKLLYKNSNSFNALILAGSFMIFLNPIILLHDPSFQLSFLATLGLISFYPIIEKVLFFLPEKLGLKEIIISNIAVQITVVPLLIYMMGEFSVISIIPNILVLPVISIFMLVSFLSILFSFVTPISVILIFITEKLSDFIVLIVNYFGNLSFSIVKVGGINLQLLLTFIFSLFALIIYLNLRDKFILKKKYNYLQS